MARRCTRRSLSNYFGMTSYHWNVRQNTVTWRWWMNGKNNVINFHWGKLCKQQKRMEYRIRVILFVLYHHTMYVINLSNISIKGNFKQIARVELKCVQYSEGDYILWRYNITMTFMTFNSRKKVIAVPSLYSVLAV
jgi:hypothetical protein